MGQNLKSPEHPVWVVCSESHFATIFLAHPTHKNSSSNSSSSSSKPSCSSSRRNDTEQLQPPLELEYYDGLAGQEAPIQLLVAAAPAGVGWSSRMEEVADERGMWQGRPIPPLECVLETKWRDVQVEWRGCEPIL